MMSISLVRALRLSSALIPAALLITTEARANPVDGQVVAGSATISTPNPSTLLIQQQTNSAIINWQSFNINFGEVTEFQLPNQNGVTLNRVTGAQNPSIIQGKLKSNGTVMVINPDGILFGDHSVVDVGGLLATTSDIDNTAFMAGSRSFNKPGKATASIVNEGRITVQNAGIAALVAPGVRNDGVIVAKLGKVTLGAANTFTLDMYGDDLIKLDLNDELIGDVIDVKTGKPLADRIKNGGTISADGGTVALKATTARKVVNSVINNTGVIEANSVGMVNGKIVLSAATATTKTSGAPVQTVKLSGTLSATGKKVGEKGGKVYVTGEVIEARAAKIDASGQSGGGAVLIGGDYLGGKATAKELADLGIAWENLVLSTGTFVSLDAASSINVDAVTDGNGGKAVVYADGATVSAATITAKGGAVIGDGGFVETSGGVLSILKAADASAVKGKAGTWLLDPLDIHIKNAADANFDTNYEEILSGIFGESDSPNASGSVISVATVEAALNAGSNVRVITRGTSGGGQGNIYVENSITKSSGGDVYAVIDSAKNVIFSSGVNLTSTSGAVSISVFAHTGSVIGNNLGTINTNGGQALVQARDGITFKTASDKPNNLYVIVGADGTSPLLTIPVDIAFGSDKVKFSYTNTLATIPTNGIQLLDSSASGFLGLDFGNLDVAFSDYALQSNLNHGWSFNVGSGHAFGAVASQALNGIPEIVAASNVSITPTSFGKSGIAPVFEVDATNADNCKALTCFSTGPEGDARINTYLHPVNQKILDPLIDVTFKIANSTPSIASSIQSQLDINYNSSIAAKGNPKLQAVIKDVLNAYNGDTHDFNDISINVDYAKIANAAYQQFNMRLPENQREVAPGWIVQDQLNGPAADDVKATVLKNKFTGEIVISFRGSVLGEGDWTGPNTQLGLSFVGLPTRTVFGSSTTANSTPTYALPAYDVPRLTNSLSFVSDYMAKNGLNSSQVSVTGHSLGGGIADYVAAKLGIHGVGFDPAPVPKAMLNNLPIGSFSYSNIINFRGSADPLTTVAGASVIGPQIKTVANTSALPYDNLFALDITAGYNHSMVNLVNGMLFVQFVNNKLVGQRSGL